MGSGTSSGRTPPSRKTPATVSIRVGGTERTVDKDISDAVDAASWNRDPASFGGEMIQVSGIGRAFITPRTRDGQPITGSSIRNLDNEIFVQLDGENNRRRVTGVLADRNNRYSHQAARAWLKLYAQRARNAAG